jgi:hypothetical protein
VARFDDLLKKEGPILQKGGIEVIELSPSEKEKFLKVAYDSAWKEILDRSPQTVPQLKELLTTKK